MKFITKNVILLLFLLLTPLFLMTTGYPAEVNAFDVDQATSMPGPTVLIRLDPQVRQRYVAPPIDHQLNLLQSAQSSSATISVNYIGSDWTPEAQAAFEFAADIWETLVVSPVPIIVDAEFGPLGPGILGGAGPVTIFRDFTNAPRSNTWYPVATANQLAQTDLDPSTADIQATFSSSFGNWYFGTDSNTPVDKINFATIALHELGHGLGFTGSMRIDNGSDNFGCTGTEGLGCFGFGGFPFIYDQFTENGAGTALINFPNNSTDLASQLTSGTIYFDGPNARATNGDRVTLYAPSIWRTGSSYSHLSEDYNDTAHALMTFSVSTGETIYDPGAVTLCMFADMDWTVNEDCQGDAGTIDGLTATNDGPTQLGSATRLKATVSSGKNVSYTWDFGDGTSGTGADVTHQYVAPGSYTATVTASNAFAQETAITNVKVQKSLHNLMLPLLMNLN